MQRARATMTGWSGGPGVMTMYGVTSGTENATTAQILTDRLHTASLQISGLFPTGWTMTGDTSVDTIDAATGNITANDAVTSWTRTGASSAGYGPLASGVVMGLITPFFIAGRRLKGRVFVSPLASEFTDTDGTPKSSVGTSINAFGAAWINAGATSTFAVVWHRPRGGAGGEAHVVTSTTYVDKFAVLRSRRD